jgi:anti-sigma factor RsiW
MSAKVLPLDNDGHDGVQALLPWYVTGRLGAAEHAAVEAHLAGCARCRVELDWERKMFAAQRVLDGEVGDAERPLAQLHRRLAADGRVVPSTASRRASPTWAARYGESRWLRWVLGVQFAANLVLGTLLVLPLFSSGTYHALGTPVTVATANVVVRFRPDATESDIRHALRQADARLVDGPTVTDAYLLSVSADRVLAAVSGLRAQRAVLLAESLSGGTRP